MVTAFFKDKGLVRQQLDSFDRFIEFTMQSIIDEDNTLEVTHLSQFTGNEGDVTVRFFFFFVFVFSDTRAFICRKNSRISSSSSVSAILVLRKMMARRRNFLPTRRGCAI